MPRPRPSPLTTADATLDAGVIPPRSVPAAVLVAMLAHTALSAGTHLVAKRATGEFPPLLLVSLRLTLSMGVFLGVLRALPGPRLPPRGTWLKLLALGALAGPLNQGLFLFGLSRSRATHGGLFYGLTPAGVYLVAVWLGRERARVSRFLGIALALVGVVVLLLGHGLKEAMGPLWGDVFLLAAVAAWVAVTTESRDLAMAHGGLKVSAWTLIGGGLIGLPALPLALIEEGAVLPSVSPTGWACLVYLVLLTSVVSYALWNFALSRVPSSKVAVFTNLQPVATAFAAWLLLGEPMTWEVLLGGGLVLLGVRLAQRP